MRTFFIIIFLLNGFLSANATENPKKNPLQQLQKQADKLFSSKMYFAAIPFYQKLYYKQNNPQNAWNLSECYWNLGYYDSAIVYLKKANINSKYSSERLAEYYFRKGNYDMARSQLDDAIVNANEKEKKYFLDKKQSSINYTSLLKDSADWVIEYLSFNTANREYAPSISNGELYFISNRDAGFILPKTNSTDGLPYDGVYKAGRINELMTVNPVVVQQPALQYSGRYLIDLTPGTSNDNNLLEQASRNQVSSPSGAMLPKILKNATFKGHVGPVNMTNNGEEIYFTRTSRRIINGVHQLEICRSFKKANGWSNPSVLSVNDSLSSSFHPFLDEQNKVLYFSSDRTGGQGGADIYRSNLLADLNWSVPINMGETFNTLKDESFPTVSDNKLYFASNGWPGLGGTDIFNNSLISPSSSPNNLGFPINSNFDDYSIVFSNSKESGYFTSNRYGSDDVLGFNYATKYVTVKSVVINQKTGLRQAGVKVILEQKDANGTWIELENYITNHKGLYEFKVRPNQTSYRFRLTGDEISSTDQIQYFDTDGVTASKELDAISVNTKINNKDESVSVSEASKPYDVPSKNMAGLNSSNKASYRIYHYFNSTGYIQESYKDLQQVIDLMNKNSGLKIKIYSAADCFGTSKLNWELSKLRAKYIQSLFPQSLQERISVEWLGNSKPAKLCNDKNRTFASEQINRYTLIELH